MKYSNSKIIVITFLCVVFCFAWSTQEKLHISIQTPFVLELRQQAEKCGKETGVPASHLRMIIDKTLPNDEDNNKFFFCVTTGGGFVDENGHFVVEKMQSFKVMNGKPEDYTNDIKECNKISKDNSINTLLAAAECLHNRYKFAPAAQQ